jgi:hypothetical protein
MHVIVYRGLGCLETDLLWESHLGSTAPLTHLVYSPPL